MKHAYYEMTGSISNVYKSEDFIKQYALESWCSTQNLYNPMKEEYFNTSFLVSEHAKNWILIRTVLLIINFKFKFQNVTLIIIILISQCTLPSTLIYYSQCNNCQWTITF